MTCKLLVTDLLQRIVFFFIENGRIDDNGTGYVSYLSAELDRKPPLSQFIILVQDECLGISTFPASVRSVVSGVSIDSLSRLRCGLQRVGRFRECGIGMGKTCIVL